VRIADVESGERQYAGELKVEAARIARIHARIAPALGVSGDQHDIVLHGAGGSQDGRLWNDDLALG